jgi:1-deoxy-D-xylulose-5-phosphate reductoisomerase
LNLEFEPLDEKRFPSLGIALRAAHLGGTYPAALVAADEMAVKQFLQGDIPFTHIPKVISHILELHKSISHPSLPEIMATYEEVKLRAQGASVL